jgi:hypothetical protein
LAEDFIFYRSFFSTSENVGLNVKRLSQLFQKEFLIHTLMLSYKGKEKLFSNTKEFIDKKSHDTGVAGGPSRIQMTGGENQNYQPRSDNRPPAPHKQAKFPGVHDKLSVSHELVDFPRTYENPSA